MSGIQVLSVTRAPGAKAHPRVAFFADWLPTIGFVPNALVQVLPQRNGMVFNLHNENITSYSELLNRTKEQAGKLITIVDCNGKKQKGAALVAFGQYVQSAGLSHGEPLLARYEYGVIEVRKLPDGAKYSTASIYKGRAWIGRKLLAGAGFMPASVAIAATQPGMITLKTITEQASQDYGALVKYARANKAQLLDVKTEITPAGVLPAIEVGNFILSKAGFTPKDMLLVTYEQGLVQLQKPDFAVLGFC